MVCYRRYGHNELDQPMYTQPKLYSKIVTHPDTLSVYGQRLLTENTCTQQDLDKIKVDANKILESEFEASKSYKSEAKDWLSSRWSGFLSPRQLSRIRQTGYPVTKLKEIGLKMCDIPSTVSIHKQLVKIIQARKDSIIAGEGVDWGTAEALAIGTLLIEGNHVRLTGQDVQRGTFSHRHAVLIDQKTGETFTPLNQLVKHTSAVAPLNKNAHPADMQAEFTCRNSILSEFGVLGFEMGYSLENPNVLVMWEAQFGGMYVRYCRLLFILLFYDYTLIIYIGVTLIN